MAGARAIRGVLGSFLGTYTSRYSEYDGYWLFGVLIADLVEMRIDLLGAPPSDPVAPADVARAIAIVRFDEQLRKAGLQRADLREASLILRRGDPATGMVDYRPSDGWRVIFAVTAVTAVGRRWSHERAVFVAPHDPTVERRSGSYRSSGG
jgi:hypothetical protein